METPTKTIRMMALFMLAMVSMLSFASALGCSYSYYSKRPLLLAPGETADVPVTLSNMVGALDVAATITISSAEGIATTPSTIYTLKAGTGDTIANVRVTVPIDAAIGTKYSVGVSMATTNPADTGQMIAVGTAIETSFPVEVVAPPQQPAPTYTSTMWVIAIIIILLIFWLVSRMMNKKQRRVVHHRKNRR